MHWAFFPLSWKISRQVLKDSLPGPDEAQPMTSPSEEYSTFTPLVANMTLTRPKDLIKFFFLFVLLLFLVFMSKKSCVHRREARRSLFAFDLLSRMSATLASVERQTSGLCYEGWITTLRSSYLRLN